MPFLSSVMKPSTAPLSQVRKAFARYDTRRNTPPDGGSRLRQPPVSTPQMERLHKQTHPIAAPAAADAQAIRG